MTSIRRAGVPLALVCVLAAWAPALAQAQQAAVENVLVVTFDGLRWQEMFGGFDATLNTKEDGGVKDPEALARRFDRPTPEGRRAALLPFIWSVAAREGQVFGDPARGSLVRTVNNL
jgi:hypothetical protein